MLEHYFSKSEPNHLISQPPWGRVIYPGLYSILSNGLSPGMTQEQDKEVAFLNSSVTNEALSMAS